MNLLINDKNSKQLEPEFKSAGKELLGMGVQLGKLDATVHKKIAAEFGIKGFPTLKTFRPNTSSYKDAVDYNGPRTADGIVSTALDALEKAGGAVPTSVELTSQEVLTSHCTGQSICIVAVLPPLVQSGKNSRNNYLEMLGDAAKSVRGKPVRFGWMSGEVQPLFEKTFDLTFGYPALVAVHFSKGRYAVLRTSYSAKGIKKFMDGIFSGKTKTMPYETLSPLVTTKEWDGEDLSDAEQEKADNKMEDDDDDDDILAEILAANAKKAKEEL